MIGSAAIKCNFSPEGRIQLSHMLPIEWGYALMLFRVILPYPAPSRTSPHVRYESCASAHP